MPFPEEVLNFKAEIVVDGAWTEITDYVYKESVQIRRGADDETTDTSPSKATFLLNNIDGRFSPRNPNSPYYGKIGRNTPVLLSVMEGDPFLDIPEGEGDHATADDFPDPAGNFDVMIDATLYNWQSPDIRELIGQISGADWSWIVTYQLGRVFFSWSDTGSDFYTLLGGPPFTVPASGRLALRVSVDIDNELVSFYQAPTIDGPWTSLTKPLVATGINIHKEGIRLAVGDAMDPGGYQRPNGRFHAARVLDGINGTPLADVNFADQTVGATAFTDAAGLEWTVNGNASINNQHNRFRGEISAWPTRWTTGGFDAWESITAESILRRYAQGILPLRSTLTRSIPKDPNIVAHWPMEEPDGATLFGATTPNTRAMTFDGDVTLAAHAAPEGSDALPSWSTNSSWHGEVNGHRFPDTGAWQVRWLANFQQLTTTEQMVMRIQASAGTVRDWRVFMDQDTVRVVGFGYGPDGELVEVFNQAIVWTFAGVGTLGEMVNLWQRWQLQAVQNGSNVEWHVAGALIESREGALFTDTFAGDIGWVNSVMGPPNGLSSQISGMSMGQIAVYSSDDLTIYDRADIGYPSETIFDRAQRLADEEGEHLIFTGHDIDVLEMGAQRPDRLLDLMRECADTDRGIFGDSRDWAGASAFRIIGRAALYNQEPVLILDYEADGEVHAPLDPTDDDQFLRNRVTVKRERGSSAIAERADGPNSVLPPPNGVGPYETEVEVNTELDTVLPDIAGWEVHLGTWDEERYPTVILRLHAAPHLIGQALRIDQGTRIRIRNARNADTRTWIPPGDIDLMVRGYEEVLSNFEWEIHLQCVPARPYDVPVLTDTPEDPQPLAHTHVDTDGSALVLAMDTDDTVLAVHVSDGPTWSDDITDYPFDLVVGGEEMTATAPGGITTVNQFFDTGVTGWTGENAGIVHSTAVVHPDPRAVASAYLTPTGANPGGPVGDLSGPGTVKPGALYTVSGWVYPTTDAMTDVRASTYWYTDAGAFVSTGTGDLRSLPARQWSFVSATLTAPATAGQVKARMRHDSLTVADTYYVWNLTVARATADWANDTFTRTVTDGWGEMDSGDDWTNTGGAASDYDVGSGYGTHLLSAVNSSRRSVISIPGPDFDLYCDVAASAVATGATLMGGIVARYTDADNLYYARVEFTTAAGITLTLRKRVGGTESTVGGTFDRELTYAAGTMFRVRFQGQGSTLRMKVWRQSDMEPPAWHITATDTSLADGDVGVRSIATTGNTNVSPVIRYDNFRVANPQALAVERSRNQVVKSHTVGTDVRLARPAITSL